MTSTTSQPAGKAPVIVKNVDNTMPLKNSIANAKAHVVSDGNMPQEEKVRLAAMMGNANAQDTRAFMNQEGKVQIIDNYEHRATLVFQGCKNCDYTLSEICTKVFIQDCENLTLTVNGTVMTATTEVYKSKNIKIFVNKKIQTLQVDLCEDLHVTYASKEVFNFVVWAGSRLTVAVGEDTHSTSFDEMAQKDKTLVFERSQFKTWYVAGKLKTEKVVRLDNGFPTTQREKNAFDARQEENMRKLSQEMFGDIKLQLPRKPREGPKVGRNDKCPCESGKKYKSCCAV